MKFYSLIILLLISAEVYGQKFVSYTQVIKVDYAFSISEGHISALIPRSFPKHQTVLDVRYSPLPDEVIEEDGVTYAKWDLNSLTFGDSIVVITDLVLERYDLNTARKIKSNIEVDPNLKDYLKEDSYYTKKNKAISEQAVKLLGKTPELTVENIFEFVTNHLEYKAFKHQERGARKALKQGIGDCTEYSELMISLCRANKIPARIVVGNVLRPSGKVGFHNWVEVYFHAYGWVAFDPTHADSSVNPTEYSKMQNYYLYLSYSRTIYRMKKWYIGHTLDYTVTYKCENLLEEKFIRATRYYYQNEYENSLKVLDSLIFLAPKSYNYYVLKGMNLARLGKFTESLELIYRGVNLAYFKSEKANAIYSLANYYALIDDPDKALTYLEKAINLGFSHKEHVLGDEDLKSLFQLQEFKDLIKKMKD